MKTIVSLALAAAAALAAVPASARDTGISGDGTYRMLIAYNDLNLSSEAGQRTLRGRIKAAANSICGPMFHMSLSERRLVDGCRNSVIHSALPQVALASRSPDAAATRLAAR